MRRDTKHVIQHGMVTRCRYCGLTLTQLLSMPATDFCKVLRSFVADHADCKPRNQEEEIEHENRD